MQHGCFRTASDVEPAILTLVLLAGGAPERYDPGFRSRNLAQQHGVRSGVVKTSSMQLQSLFARWAIRCYCGKDGSQNTDDRNPLRASKAWSSRRQDGAPLGNGFSQLRISG